MEELFEEYFNAQPEIEASQNSLSELMQKQETGINGCLFKCLNEDCTNPIHSTVWRILSHSSQTYNSL